MSAAHAVLDEHGAIPLVVAAVLYMVIYLLKTPCRTSVLPGQAWVDELLVGSPRRFREVMRMEQETFRCLRRHLIDKDLLRASRWASVDEKLAIFLYMSGTPQRTAMPKDGSSAAVGQLRDVLMMSYVRS